MSTVHTIETPSHGRYLVRTPHTTGPHALIVGFHGYGENAVVHLDALTRTVGERPWIVVSVQALHRFYSRGDRDIVASWMTREDRELGIADNIAYVKRVVSAVRAQHSTRAPLVYAGFSQGAAMAYRAAAFGEAAQALVVLAGDVPPDVAPVADRLPRTLIGRGTADEWYTEAKAAADLVTLSTAGVQVETHVFDGGHVWTDDFASAATSILDELEGLRLGRAP